ncbi:hypothetical protein QAD02_010659 [Eretmocerus hayati]|uniref:Uncharacterized protein n=1 Tax=Eretmocerus hayati TaxID=131215 RepID=A0ACC2NUJ3_9HYME|nr:hypothetical protein QAD02_010659 [Eretmocerus hayati]
MLKIGFIGGGKMAQALAKGFISAGLTKGEMVVASCLPSDESSIKEFETMNSKVIFSNAEVVNLSEVLLLAVKPQVVRQVLPEVKQSLEREKKLLLSIAMGVSLKTLERNLPEGNPVMRVMPNIPVVVGHGATVFVRGSHADEYHTKITKELFSAVGLCEEVPESMINPITALAGSGPAYVYMMIEAMADGAVKMGLPRDLAYRLASQTVLGAGAMVKETNIHPGELKDAVSSPAGSTIAAIHMLEKNGFRGAMIDAIEAATIRCKEFSPFSDKD